MALFSAFVLNLFTSFLFRHQVALFIWVCVLVPFSAFSLYSFRRRFRFVVRFRFQSRLLFRFWFHFFVSVVVNAFCLRFRCPFPFSIPFSFSRVLFVLGYGVVSAHAHQLPHVCTYARFPPRDLDLPVQPHHRPARTTEADRFRLWDPSRLHDLGKLSSVGILSTQALLCKHKGTTLMFPQLSSVFMYSRRSEN